MRDTLNRATGGLFGRMMQNTFLRYFVFAFGGGMSYVLLLTVTYLLTSLAAISDIVSYWIGLACAVIFAFIYHRFITFNAMTRWQQRFAKFFALEIVIAIANGVLVYLLTKKMIIQFLAPIDQIHFISAKVSLYFLIITFCVTLLLSVINFTMNRFWVFRDG